ncbi:DTX3L-like protein [Mya arenaria]|uniref:E3 ubiquitin-protein ligase n=1 Tax=Mya arenaria TaxID=6604 RepID=A0ABY7FNH6_MYAAR|nr:E3 ubiquitin-protein ligase DTX3L-like [Mya arenaria]WAR22414.1 DTX3L-like protein [Mya arenaria]
MEILTYNPVGSNIDHISAIKPMDCSSSSDDEVYMNDLGDTTGAPAATAEATPAEHKPGLSEEFRLPSSTKPTSTELFMTTRSDSGDDDDGLFSENETTTHVGKIETNDKNSENGNKGEFGSLTEELCELDICSSDDEDIGSKSAEQLFHRQQGSNILNSYSHATELSEAKTKVENAEATCTSPNQTQDNEVNAQPQKADNPIMDGDDEEDRCCICLDTHSNPKVLHKCSHKFCTECIDTHFRIKPVCPVCFVAYGVITGNMPEGHMSDYVSKKVRLQGYESYNTIVISYSFSDGTQKDHHPHPGMAYHGTNRTAYLPDNPEGKKVLRLLKESFKRRLTFTVGRSVTTGCDNVVTWNDIHHKTCTNGGQENFGYPDPTYLQRVQQELAAVGVTEESL